MTELVHPDKIEGLVGASRSQTLHIGRVDSDDGIFYILHSQDCRDNTPNLRDCPFSLALDRGFDVDAWTQNAPLMLGILDGNLVDSSYCQDVEHD